jgi:hypothetical protein
MDHADAHRCGPRPRAADTRRSLPTAGAVRRDLDNRRRLRFAGTAKQVGTVTDRNPGTFNDLVAHTTLHFIGRDESGAIAQTRDLIVLNLRGGEAIVDRQRLDARCTGRR